MNTFTNFLKFHFLVVALLTQTFALQAQVEKKETDTKPKMEQTTPDRNLLSLGTSVSPGIVGAEPVIFKTNNSKMPENGHFSWTGGNPAENTWSIYLNLAQLDGVDLVPGDEIAILDGIKIVGVVTLMETPIPGYFNVALIAFSVLSDFSEGFVPGHAFSLKCWDQSAGVEISNFTIELTDPYGGAWTQLVFPADYDLYSVATIQFICTGAASTHFIWPGGNAAENSWTIYLDLAQLNGINLVPGDEIAILDGTKIVGVETLIETPVPGAFNESLLAFKVLANLSAGYTPGNPISLKCWDQSAGIEITAYDIFLANPYGDAWTQLVFPADNNLYSIATIQFINCPILFAPNDLSTISITTSSAKLQWMAGGQENRWDVIYGYAGFEPETSGTLIQGVNDTTYILNTLTPATNYAFYVRSKCGVVNFSDWAGPKTFNTLAFETVWNSPFQPMSIFVTKATMDALNMVAGDEIGVFDIDTENGNEICVGAGILTDELTGGAFLEIVVSMDDGIGATNGFQPDNEMIFKLFTPETGVVNYVLVSFPYPEYDEVFSPLGTAVVELVGLSVITQTIDMTTGWNMVSFRVNPENMDMLNIFNPIVMANQLVKVLDQNGESIIHLPFPQPDGQWTNTIGDMTIEQGYYVNVTENTSLTIEGKPVYMPFEIPLRAGWNMISIPCSEAQSTQQTLQTLIGEGKLIKVINDAGQSIIHLPFPPPNGQWSYGFTSFVPGEGYYIKVSVETSLVFDCNITDGTTSFDPVQSRIPDYFQPVYQNNPFMPMTVALSFDSEIEEGDEIGIFDGEICVGALIAGSEDFVVIPVSMDDPGTETIDGFAEGNPIIARIWHPASNVAEEAGLIYLEGSENFQPLETYAGKIKGLLTSVQNQQTTSLIYFDISPNPLHGKAMIKYSIPTAGKVSVDLVNVDGRHLKNLLNEIMPAGVGEIDLVSDFIMSGCYLIKFNYAGAEQETIIRKLIIY